MGKIADHLRNATAPTLKGSVDVGPDGGQFVDVQTTEPVTDWTQIFTRFNLDPDVFEVVGDTVRMSNWQQSKRTNDGDRDVINLYSYRATFTRKAANLVDLAELTASIRAWHPATKPPKRSKTPAEAYVVALADWQLGKSERGLGTQHTVDTLNSCLQATVHDIEQLRANGHNLTTLVIANMGDHTEGVSGHYASQTATIDLNLRAQLKLALELNMQWIKTLAPMFQQVTYTSVLCNHGQLSNGTGHVNITDDSDNASGLIGDLLKTVCNLHPDLKHVQFVVPHDEMITTVEAAGVRIAMAHGQKITGQEKAWLDAQSQWLTRTNGFVPDVWLTAHRHHAQLTDYGPYTRIQATTVDPGSKWWTDSTGLWSRPGTTVFTVNAEAHAKHDHYRVLL